MDQFALRLEGDGRWQYLGGRQDAKKPLEVVLRAFDAEIEFASGSRAEVADGPVVRVPPGEGRRIEGRHFFARAPSACRCSVRGL